MQFKSVYFLGAGGIGMSALERYFLRQGLFVAGYDRTPSALTDALVQEGVQIHFEDDPALIPDECKDPETTLVVYTPAIPSEHREMAWLRNGGFRIEKRAQVLGTLTQTLQGLCVAGTHGKTSTSAMTAHLLDQSAVGCNAFLGGIAKNHGTNYLLSPDSRYVVIEADEFDRSFHHLRPFATVITSADPDHLDIYGTEEAYLESFSHYTSLISPGGALVVHRGLRFEERLQDGVRRYEYGRHEGDFHAENIRIGGGRILFDLVSPIENITDIEPGVPVSINIDNGIAACALAQLAGVSADEIRHAMKTYQGVERRFDFKIKNDRCVFLSDYAHHPAEIRQSVLSLREVFDGRKISAVFQPHLYSRTRDFHEDFAEALSLLDEVILLDIYPARELPIEGVSSQMIFDRLRPDMQKRMAHKEDLPRIVAEEDFDVLVVLGAGDVDNYCGHLTEILLSKSAS
ncbi:UDP-N-acetylmuramate--L-alanine ligase [Alloprevotella sp. OH1205_COT-284]|uniref:UDP-N-acetylmuramate--L-alanine ligase n=1 Tax=Alloprevotella sp. OH1205_COT-284 TaxID=2491043 RepID=UPI000F5D60BB|nr:Mur ligase family protein [Alloprevotella sp. OH1205_COT-284]RRD77747.1 UDP-N-acetylmuramate--L-alanine ligase [Alloprevotella sp. OH1205_COT-284]